MDRMLTLAEEKASVFRRRSLGEVRPVLWEEESETGVYSGLTDNYLKVRVSTSRPLANEITWARLTEEREGVIYSEVV